MSSHCQTCCQGWKRVGCTPSSLSAAYVADALSTDSEATLTRSNFFIISFLFLIRLDPRSYRALVRRGMHGNQSTSANPLADGVVAGASVGVWRCHRRCKARCNRQSKHQHAHFKSPPFSFHHYSITNAPIHRSVDSHPSNAQDGSSDDLSIRWATTGGPTPLGRSDAVLRFVLSRQRFVRCCHGRKSPSHCWLGPVSRAGLMSRYSALPLCVTGRAEHFLLTSIVNCSWRVIFWTRPATAVGS